MRIIIDIGHPAHVHLFKYFTWEMQKNGHTIFFTCRDKEFEIFLLKKYNFVFKSFGKKYSTKLGKIWGLIEFDIKEFIAGLKFKPDLFLSHGSIYASHAAFLLNKPHISLEDSGNWEQIKLYLPFTQAVLTPQVLSENLGEKQIRYNGYHELVYLHPRKFVSDKEIKYSLGLDQYDEYALLRFVSWKATHDYGHAGFTLEDKFFLLQTLLEKNIQPIISSESELPEEFHKYKFSISPDKMHSTIAHAKIFIGEGATMASEAGVLGVPSIYVNSIPRSYCEDQEKYGLIFNFRNGNGVVEKVDQILQISNLSEEWQRRREKMLEDKIDINSYLVWFVENYPKSFTIMKENPDYQYKFR